MPTTTTNPLTTSLTTNEPDQIASLHLIADSIAQQRQLAARSMLTHPASLSLLTLSLFITYFFTRALSTTTSGEKDKLPFLLLITWPACIMVYLLAAAHTTHPYLEKAGRTGTWVWLWRGGTRYKHRRRHSPPLPPAEASLSTPSTARGEYKTPMRKDQHDAEDNKEHRKGEEEEEDIMLVTKYHNRVIGTLVLRIIRTEEELWGHVRDAVVREELYQTSSSSSSAAAASTSSSVSTPACQPVGVIRAWTVAQHFRGIGVGKNLLVIAIRMCRECGITGPVFSDCHANEVLGLPVVCNGELARRERWAREVLKGVKREVEEDIRMEGVIFR